MRRRLQLIFQDPIASLNPRRCIGDIVAEPLVIIGVTDKAERERRVREVLTAVGLDADLVIGRLPHEFSGGQCQRICIARALILEPELVICDEPVSALDVSIRAQILNLLEDMKRRYGLTLLFIAHDLAVVKAVSDRIAVMYLGRLCEVGPTEQLFAQPAHPYTALLLEAIPVPDPTVRPAANVAGRRAAIAARAAVGLPLPHPLPARRRACAPTVVPPLARDRRRPVRRLPPPADRPLTMPAPMRTLNRPKPTVDVERRADGTLILSAGRSLPADLPLVIDLLQRAAERRPDVTFLAERRGPDRAWQRLTYAEAWARTGAIASWLIAQGFGPDQPSRSPSCPTTASRTRCSCSAPCAPARWWRRSRPTTRCPATSRASTTRCRSSSPAWCSRRTSARYAAALDRTKARDRHRRRQARPCLRRAGQLLDRCVGGRAPPAHHGRNAGQDPVHLGLDRPAQGRAEHPRQSRFGGRDEPLAGRAARREPHRRVARLAALASHLGRQLQPERRHPLGRLLIYRRRPPLAGPLPGDPGEPARALALGLRHGPRRLSAAARGARARRGPARRNSSRTCAAWATAARCCRRRASTACRAWPPASSASACRSAAAGA